MTTYKEGLTIRQLKLLLLKVSESDLDKPVLISSDEEQNTLFKGFYIELYEDSLVFAGLSGCEYNEDSESFNKSCEICNTKKEVLKMSELELKRAIDSNKFICDYCFKQKED